MKITGLMRHPKAELVHIIWPILLICCDLTQETVSVSLDICP